MIIETAVIVMAFAQPNVCEMKKVEDGYWCDYCKKLLPPGEIADSTYCKACSQGKTGDDRAKVRKLKVCTRTYYQCPEFYLVCDGCRQARTSEPCPLRACQESGARMREPRDHDRKFAAGKCKCGKVLKAVVDKALIVYICEGCSNEAEKNEPCLKPGCKKDKKKRNPACTRSGTFPHGPERRLGD